MLITICLITGVVLAVAGTLVFVFVTDDWECAVPCFVVAIILCLLLCMAVGAVIEAVFNKSTVETNLVEAEVTHLDITESKGRTAPATVTYRVSVLGDDGFAAVVEVAPDAYARLKVGDKVTVKVTTTSNTLIEDTIKYSIVSGD